jgi:hypothetical protein
MAHIIALQGAGNSGKTSTLLEVFAQLKVKYPLAKIDEYHQGTHDIKVVLHNIKGKVVGIESRGDPGSRLETSLPDLLKKKCDIIFCACRTRGMTVDWINAYKKANNVQFIPQTYVSAGHKASNTATAKSLIKMAGL